MKPSPASILTVNGGSSSIKFALYAAGEPPQQRLHGGLDGIGQAQASLWVEGQEPGDRWKRAVTAPDHAAAVAALMDWVQQRFAAEPLAGIGHRVVHGGPRYSQPARVDAAMLAELQRLSPLDPEHLPEEILLTQAFHRRFPSLPQVACFDTAFHHGLPAVARLLPLPRRYQEQGLRRFGFHGLSYANLMEQLAALDGAAAQGRVVLAHLGSGASLAAVQGGRSIDTSMGLTPAGGIPMSTRSGDLDPGLAWQLWRSEGMDGDAFHAMVNHQSGLLGLSGSSGDMAQLLAREAQDPRAAEAVDLFCYQVKKTIGAYAAALGGLDCLVFAAGIGEHAPTVRERACRGLGFLGLELDPARNAANASVISTDPSRVKVRVLRTDEELMIARSVITVLG